jgi:NADP-dependent 3-hydroxy acid dehydrogenase YdfG
MRMSVQKTSEIHFEDTRCLQNQIAVVTGASSGIGRAIALDLARRGAEVCLVSRRRDILEVVAQEALGEGGQAHVGCADLTRDEDIRALSTMMEQDFGRLDVLVLCGGVIFHGATEQAMLEQLDLQYRANVRGHYALTQALLPLLRKQRGQAVFINSSAATRPSSAGVGQFSSTQYALRAIGDSLREEVSADGIRVLSVFPGRTATPRVAALFEKEGKPYTPELLLQPEDVATMVAHALHLPRSAEITDISIRPMAKW